MRGCNGSLKVAGLLQGRSGVFVGWGEDEVFGVVLGVKNGDFLSQCGSETPSPYVKKSLKISRF